MSIYNLFSLLCGIALFLLGMHLLSDGMNRIAGDNMRSVLEKTTKNRFLSILVGTGVTAVIQSSAATTVMAMSFVSAGMMTLMQAFGVIMGANIGTTITAQIIAFNIGSVATLIFFLGAIPYLFIKNNTVKSIGALVMGFGMLFMGLSTMGDAVEPLKDSPFFYDFLLSLENPFIAIIAGVVITSILQSSSVSVGIVQTFAARGLMTLDISIYLIIGMAIGACVPSVIAAFTSNRDGKRAALLGVIFNVIRAVICGLLVTFVPQIITFVKTISPDDTARQIANMHMMFALIAVIVELPLMKYIIKLSQIIIPIDESEKHKVERKLIYINKNLMSRSPALAVSQAKHEVCRMGHITYDNLKLALDSFFEKNTSYAETVLETEKTINYFNHAITETLVSYSSLDLSPKDQHTLGMMFHVVSDIERIGDHAENIAEYTILEKQKSANMSEVGTNELRELAQAALGVYEQCLKIYETEDFASLDAASEAEENVDSLQKKFTDNHVQRLMSDHCDPLGGVVFNDMLTDLERCSDHAINIAFAITTESFSGISSEDTANA